MKTKTKTRKTKPDPTIVAGIVARIVKAADPEKIVLFGSAARGEMGPNSDYDFLVIKRGKFNYWQVLSNIYRSMRGKGAAADIVLVHSADVERYRDAHCTVLGPALQEGMVVFDSEVPTADRSHRMARSRQKQPGSRAGRKR
jgi:uncharacterized protein